MKIKIIWFICSVLQIVGFVLIVSQGFTKGIGFVNILIGISGFAAVVKFFIEDEEKMPINFRWTTAVAAVAGFGIVVLACLYTL